MAAHKRRPAAAVLLLLLVNSLGYANAASLEILPSGDTQTKPVGSSIILTCRPSVDDLKLISQMQWLDAHNRVIESLKLVVLPIESTHPENTKPEMYTELNPDNTLSLFFNHLEEKQGGKYTCTGTYANSVPLNKTVTIETIDAIKWVNAPPNQYPILGDDFSILCKVRARPAPSVNWLYNGELIKPNERYTIDRDVLKIQNVQESDDGVYTCRASVTSTGELQERAIRVEVHVKPTIEEIPSPVEIIEGENANIECIAKGKPPPKYSWVKSLTQQNLSNADGFGVDADTGILTITNANRDDAGEYQCIAINAADSARTTIIINVIVKPKIMEFENSTVVQGKKVEISCKAFGRPPPVITFSKHTSEKPYVMGVQPDDDTIILTNRPDDNSGETVGTLSIDQAMRSNDGLYQCIAQNPGDIAYKTGHLTVEFPPSFASMPNITVWSWEQRPVNISCIAESIPNATIRWTMHGDQKVENIDRITQYGHGPVSILRIEPADKRYYTSYKCIAANPHGTREHIIELREATKPGELAQAIMTEVTATTIKFDLQPPSSHPELPIRTITVQYRENREQQSWAQAKNKTWSVGSVYAIEGLKPQTMYEFRFAAGNEVGLGNWGKNHVETTPGRSVPKMPIMIKTSGAEYEVSQQNSQYELSWLTPADNGEPIDKYQVTYCPIKRESGEWVDDQDSSCTIDEIRGSGRTRFWIKGLQPDSFYRIELKAHNAMGFSDPSIGRFKTARGVVDTTVVHHQGPLISSAAIIGIVIAVLFIIIIVIDVICCCAHKTGIIYYVCERSRRKPVDEDDAKLGRDEKEPLKEEKKITPIIDTGLRRETSITFDGKRSISKTGFVGKDSAV